MTLSAAAIRKRAQRAHPTMTRCERCGSTERLSRHHPDYSMPERIVVLCATCHPRMDAEDGTRRTKKPKTCATCGVTFTNYSHSRVQNCSRRCVAEAGRRAAMKRWGGGTSNLPSDESPVASPSASTDLGASGTPSSRRSRNGSDGGSSNGSA